jgi:hypothetical protein
MYSCAHWLRPRNSSPPPHLGSYTRALLVIQDRRHLFVKPRASQRYHSHRYLYGKFASLAAADSLKLPAQVVGALAPDAASNIGPKYN